ncbi:DDE-type integrase/transposase/recombinase [Chloroflexota bacterium]
MLDSTLKEMIMRLNRKVVDDIQEGKLKTERVTCRFCDSEVVWRYGKNRSGVQRYKCPQCDKVFLDVDALPKMRVAIRQLGDIMGQYYGGMSYKELRRQFKQQHDTEMSRSSFHRWLTKFTKIAVDEADKYHPKVGGKWIADECVLKVNGKNTWCWDIIDSDTRFLLATHLSPTRTTQDAKKLMEKAAKVAGKAPKLVITDALRAYIDGIELAFGAETVHIQSKPFAEADISTNLIERWHSTLRAREGIMRGLKSIPTAQALLDSWLVHYNFFRGHESLDDKTPAEVAGVKFPYRDWLDVIEGQRVVIEPEPEIAETPAEQVEKWKHPTYKVHQRRKVRKVRRVSRKGMDTAIKEIRR